jgi:predicted nuclease with TOPRIM domain
MMTEMAQAGGPEVAAVLLPRIAKLMDIPDADKIAGEIEAKVNPQQQGLPPELQQQIDEGMQRLQQLEQENAQLKADQQQKMVEAQLKSRELDIQEQDTQIKFYDAQTNRAKAMQPTMVRGEPTSYPQ